MIRKFQDGTGNYLVASMGDGDSLRLLGKPVSLCEDLPNIGTDSYPIIYGDLALAMFVVEKDVMNIVQDQVTRPGFTRFYISWRIGNLLVDDNAYKALKIATT